MSVSGEGTMAVRRTHLIWFVADQDASTRFYARALAKEPSLHVPGMTEFTLAEGVVLGLMPESGAQRLHPHHPFDLARASGVPRGELYLVVEDAGSAHRRALDAGAVEVSPLQVRSWGDRAAYSLDPDGHLLVFAESGPALDPGASGGPGAEGVS